jgi:hypothetical protein
MQYWNGTNTLVRLRTSAALTYDYEVAYQVFRDWRVALSDGPCTPSPRSTLWPTRPVSRKRPVYPPTSRSD